MRAIDFASLLYVCLYVFRLISHGYGIIVVYGIAMSVMLALVLLYRVKHGVISEKKKKKTIKKDKKKKNLTWSKYSRGLHGWLIVYRALTNCVPLAF